jgi:hypothetical protein
LSSSKLEHKLPPCEEISLENVIIESNAWDFIGENTRVLKLSGCTVTVWSSSKKSNLDHVEITNPKGEGDLFGMEFLEHLKNLSCLDLNLNLSAKNWRILFKLIPRDNLCLINLKNCNVKEIDLDEWYGVKVDSDIGCKKINKN